MFQNKIWISSEEKQGISITTACVTVRNKTARMPRKGEDELLRVESASTVITEETDARLIGNISNRQLREE